MHANDTSTLNELEVDAQRQLDRANARNHNDRTEIQQQVSDLIETWTERLNMLDFDVRVSFDEDPGDGDSYIHAPWASRLIELSLAPSLYDLNEEAVELLVISNLLSVQLNPMRHAFCQLGSTAGLLDSESGTDIRDAAWQHAQEETVSRLTVALARTYGVGEWPAIT
jgi:hypothetical protein